MAKKKTPGLTQRIESLINWVGAKPAPSMADIKSELVPCLGLAQALEDGAEIRDAESKIAVLETALEESNAQTEQLQSELQTAKTELERFQAERRKQEEQDRDIPDIQFKILKRLPLVHQHGYRLDRIAWDAGIALDEAEIHLDALCKMKPALARIHQTWPFIQETGWKRTMAGNRYVVARRLAGEEEQQTHRYADLPDTQHQALLLIAARMGAGASESYVAKKLRKSFGSTRFVFNALREGDFAGDPFEDQNRPSADRTFYLRTSGAEYLNERSLL